MNLDPLRKAIKFAIGASFILGIIIGTLFGAITVMIGAIK